MQEFEERTGRTFSRAQNIAETRGGKYHDTWKTCQFLTMKAVYEKLTGRTMPDDIYAALCAAAFVDMKYERRAGGWDDDHCMDGINYEAFLVDKMRELTMINDNGVKFWGFPIETEPPHPNYPKTDDSILAGSHGFCGLKHVPVQEATHGGPG